jgi:hypothetical protein
MFIHQFEILKQKNIFVHAERTELQVAHYVLNQHNI